MNVPGGPLAPDRLLQIARARRAVMEEGLSMTDMLVHGWLEGAWIERSWRRCLELGQRPQDPVAFDVVPEQHMRRVPGPPTPPPAPSRTPRARNTRSAAVRGNRRKWAAADRPACGRA